MDFFLTDADIREFFETKLELYKFGRVVVYWLICCSFQRSSTLIGADPTHIWTVNDGKWKMNLIKLFDEWWCTREITVPKLTAIDYQSVVHAHKIDESHILSFRTLHDGINAIHRQIQKKKTGPRIHKEVNDKTRKLYAAIPFYLYLRLVHIMYIPRSYYGLPLKTAANNNNNYYYYDIMEKKVFVTRSYYKCLVKFTFIIIIVCSSCCCCCCLLLLLLRGIHCWAYCLIFLIM